jgi:hypothetical protein
MSSVFSDMQYFTNLDTHLSAAVNFPTQDFTKICSILFNIEDYGVAVEGIVIFFR